MLFKTLTSLTDTFRSLKNNRIPGQLVIQYTDMCNATCPKCGMRKTEKFKRSRLSNDRIRAMLDRAAENGVKAVSFTGGEPLIHFDDLVDQMDHAGKAGFEYIRTGTNGFIFSDPDNPDFTSRVQRIADRMAATKIRNFWISVDSAVPEVHEAMRGFPGVIKGIEKALPIFHDVGIYPSANLGINRNIAGYPKKADTADEQAFFEHFTTGFERFYRFVIDLGFTIVNTCYPMSISEEDKDRLQAVYAATSVEDIVRFTGFEKTLLFSALLQTIPKFRGDIRIFSPGCSLHSLVQQYKGRPETCFPCRGGIDFFFVDAQKGDTFPCGYRGDDNFGAYEAFGPDKPADSVDCLRCDWECFRDPSELFGPFLQMFTHPMALIKRLGADSRFFGLWAKDLAYYQACDFFNGRRPPRPERLRWFSA